MDQTFTLREIAHSIGEMDGRDANATEKLYQQLRVLVQRGVFQAYTPDVSRGKTAAYDLRTFCAVRHFVVLYDIGLDAANLRQTIVSPNIYTGPGVRPAMGIDAAIAGTLNGENWLLEVAFRRHRNTGERKLISTFRRSDDDSDEEVSRILDAWGALQATIILPSSDLLRPILVREG